MSIKSRRIQHLGVQKNGEQLWRVIFMTVLNSCEHIKRPLNMWNHLFFHGMFHFINNPDHHKSSILLGFSITNIINNPYCWWVFSSTPRPTRFITRRPWASSWTWRTFAGMRWHMWRTFRFNGFNGFNDRTKRGIELRVIQGELMIMVVFYAIVTKKNADFMGFLADLWLAIVVNFLRFMNEALFITGGPIL